MSYKTIGRHEKYNSNENAKQLNINRLNNILEIKKLCTENGAKLVLTMIPWYKTLVDKINYSKRYYYPLKVFCDNNSIHFFDMNVNSDINWEYYYFGEQDYTQNTHLNAYGQHKASCELTYYLDSIDDNFILIKDSPQLTKLNDYLSTIDNNNDVLIIDKCPNPIDLEVFLLVKDEFKRLGISPSQELDKDIDIQYISDGIKYDEFTNHQNMHPEELAVNIYKLDKDTKEIISHVVTRWDVFDTVFWVND